MSFVFLIFFLVGSISDAGISTNGSNVTTDQDNVWNLGDKPVFYCIERVPLFSMSFTESRELIRETIQDWILFFQKYDLDKMSFNKLKYNKDLKMSLRFHELEKCGDDPETVRFVLGGEVPDAQHALAHDFHEHALALAIRKDYNHETYRNGGIVWLRNSYLPRDQIKHLLLHEVGHVFGMPHDSVYVMDAKVADKVRLDSFRSLYGMIESATWIYRLNSGDSITFSANGRVSNAYEPNFLLLGLSRAFDFNVRGNHEVKLKLEAKSSKFPAWDATWTFKEAETSQTREMKGVLLYAEPTHNLITGTQGPVLYTKWYCETCRKEGSSYRRYLDTRPSGLEAAGRLTYNGLDYPAVLENRRGVLFRVFIAGTDLWWTSQHYSSSTAVIR